MDMVKILDQSQLPEPEVDDFDLVQRISDGDQRALALIYRRYSGQVFGLAKRIIRNNELAADVVQDVFVSLWNRPEAFDRDRGTLRTFLLAKTHGRTIDIIRSESARRIREERDIRLTAQAEPTVDEEVWQMTLVTKVRDAVAGLPDRERQVIELAYLGGLTYREVALRLEMPEGTVKSRIRSGLARLQNEMRQAGMIAA